MKLSHTLAAVLVLGGPSLLAVAQEAPRSRAATSDSSAADSQDLFRRLEIMRHVLVRSLNDARGEVAASGKTGLNDFLFGAKPAPNGMMLREDFDSRVDYLPGYGAVFTFTVPVKVRPVKSEHKSADGDPEKSKDGLWEQAENELQGNSSVWNGVFPKPADGPDSFSAARDFQAVQQYAGEQTVCEYDPEALAALKATLAAPLARCAKRLNLNAKDWIGVSVRLLPMTDALARFSSANVLGAYVQQGMMKNRGHRLVLQIANEDLLKLAGQDARGEDVLKKAEVDVLASEITLGSLGSLDPDNSGRSRAR